MEEDQDSLSLKCCLHLFFFPTVFIEKQVDKGSDSAEKTVSVKQPFPVQQTEKTVQGESMTSKKAKVGSVNILIELSYWIVLSRAVNMF